MYSPVLGPSIREAVGRWGVDLILDGEILAWDDGKKENIPFGANRTVAKMRRDWLHSRGFLDDRDRHLHDDEGDDGTKVMNKSFFWNEDAASPEISGRECWLQFVAFDILYVGGGERAQDLLRTTVSPFLRDDIKPGSILHLDALERKKLLYRIIEPVEKKVEIVLTTVVRPNGESADGQLYFSYDEPLMDNGHPAHLLDSITAAFNGYVKNLPAIDERRRGHMSDEEISKARARIVGVQYKNIVLDLFLEGLLFKDLSAPYVLDNPSRLMGYWRKFKPDYYDGSAASDLDLIVIGAYFATGQRNAGQPSSFLLACLDNDRKDHYFPVVKVNAGSLKQDQLNNLLQETGFRKATKDQKVQTGQWSWNEDNEVPWFLSENMETRQPWKPAKKEKPDMWLDPHDKAIVLTITAGEFQYGPSFPLGLTLRFPRITRIRSDKEAHEIETAEHLWSISNKVDMERAQSANSFTQAVTVGGKTLKVFWTESEAKNKKRTVNRSRKALVQAKIAPEPKKLKSNAFRGLCFSILDGVFTLEGMDTEEAKTDGWMEFASSVKTKQSIELFIKSHGGKVIISPDEYCMVLGGKKDDARVTGHVRAIEKARLQPLPRSKNPTQKSLKNHRIAKGTGVLRWTFPFSLLARWLSKPAQEREGMSIKEAFPELAIPNSLDYLARPLSPRETDRLRDIEQVDNIFMMRRALEMVQDMKHTDESNDWYRDYHNALDESDLWVLSSLGKHEELLWPSQMEGLTEQVTTKRIVIFPDLIRLPDGTPDPTAITNEIINSVLPLLKLYGSTIENDLNDSVTHMVCNLQNGIDFFQYKKQRDTDIDANSIFRDAERGDYLLRKMDVVFSQSDRSDVVILIVSPSWVRKCTASRWSTG